MRPPRAFATPFLHGHAALGSGPIAYLAVLLLPPAPPSPPAPLPPPPYPAPPLSPSRFGSVRSKAERRSLATEDGKRAEGAATAAASGKHTRAPACTNRRRWRSATRVAATETDVCSGYR
eukprot:5489099-Pyramimonas_sp.AAC.1